MRANDGRYIAVVLKGRNIETVRFEEENAVAFAKQYRAYVVVNGATGALVKQVGKITDAMWDKVAELRRALRTR